MDANTLLSGLIPGLIGAAATIASAFIAKAYTERKIEQTLPDQPFSNWTSVLVRVLGFFQIDAARKFKIPNRESVVDPQIGLCIGVERKMNGPARIDLTVALPGETAHKMGIVRPGWTMLFEWGGVHYRLTYLRDSIGFSNLNAVFELRALSSTAVASPK